MEVICLLCQLLENDLSKNVEVEKSSECDTALSLALLEVLKNMRVSIEKLLVMVSS